ncbi:major facilitator superfamily domain-containing protein [Xylariomycetidae sp. FL2044]|nr:major facilitator superfamily domain-containing protein [Xylariomycetidae sp. FL2044]
MVRADVREGTTQEGQGLHVRLAILTLAVATIAVGVDGTSLAAAIPVISTSIPGTQVETFWAGASYLLASTSVVFLWVSLSEVLGRRTMTIVSLFVLIVGSIVCATAKNYSIMLVGRTIQGLSSGGIVGLTLVVITDLVPLAERARTLALISSVFAIGSIGGPVIGGACAVTGQWRWIYWLNLPIAGISLIGATLYLKVPRDNASLAGKLSEIDWPGLLLFAASATAALIPIVWGGVQFPWDSWHTIVPLVVGLVGIVFFAFYEGYIAKRPFLPLYIFRNYSTSITFVGSFINGILLYAQVYYMPEYFQAVKLYSPLISGVAALPGSLTAIPCAAFTGAVVARTGHYRWAIWTGWALATFGFGIMYLLDVNTSIPAWIFIRIAAGLGTGMLLPALNIALQASVPQADVAMGTTMFTFLRDFGHAVGVSIGSSILDNMVRTQLHRPAVMSVVPADLINLSPTELIPIVQGMPDNAVSLALRTALAQAFKVIWATTCGLAGFGLLLHLLVKEYDLKQEAIIDQSSPKGGDMPIIEDANKKHSKA